MPNQDPTSAFFTVERGTGGEVFHPLEPSRSGWNEQHMRGPAITGILARATELGTSESMNGLRPVRFAVDLFRPSRMLPSYTRVAVVQRGRRLGLVDAQLCQGEEIVARAQTLFFAPTANTGGQLWQEQRVAPDLPPEEVAPDAEGRRYRSGTAPWSTTAEAHVNDSLKRVWQQPFSVVEGEAPTPFQQLGCAADMANLVLHWGTDGVEYINADVTLSFARLPVGGGIGLVAADRTTVDGISTGSASYYDADGPFGRATLCALANAAAALRPGVRAME